MMSGAMPKLPESTAIGTGCRDSRHKLVVVVRPQLMTMLLKARFRKRIWYLLVFVAMIGAGLISRRFPHVLPAIAVKYPGDVLWALMVFFGMGAVFRNASSLQLGLGALGFSFGIEVLKLCQAPWLVSVRHTALGHLIFGQVFSWQNLVAYTAGILTGVVTEVLIVPNKSATPTTIGADRFSDQSAKVQL
jgi:hypothetical protein